VRRCRWPAEPSPPPGWPGSARSTRRPGIAAAAFGGAATAAVTQAALDGGAEGVLLFTDLANRTSNTLYQRLGFAPVTDWVVLTFTGPAL
jgi:predicted GNAT family acetyltransferase